MLENVQVIKRDDKIVFFTDSFESANELTKMLSYEGHADTIVRVNDDIYRIKKLKDKIITVQIEGKFEELKSSQNATSQKRSGEK